LIKINRLQKLMGGLPVKFQLSKVLVMGGLVLATLFGSSAYAVNFYKYKDEAGSLVMSFDIPAERVKYGYQIVDSRGRVIQEVARQLTAEEYHEKLHREEALISCNQARRRVLNLYQNLEDIDYAEGKAVQSVDTSITNLRANLTHISNQKKEFETRAAQMDIAGQKLPTVLLGNIEKAEAEVTNIELSITRKRTERGNLNREYRYDRGVFGLTDCSNGLPQPLVIAGESTE
jgi:hypothetical protein